MLVHIPKLSPGKLGVASALNHWHQDSPTPSRGNGEELRPTKGAGGYTSGEFSASGHDGEFSVWLVKFRRVFPRHFKPQPSATILR